MTSVVGMLGLQGCVRGLQKLRRSGSEDLALARWPSASVPDFGQQGHTGAHWPFRVWGLTLSEAGAAAPGREQSLLLTSCAVLPGRPCGSSWRGRCCCAGLTQRVSRRPEERTSGSIGAGEAAGGGGARRAAISGSVRWVPCLCTEGLSNAVTTAVKSHAREDPRGRVIHTDPGPIPGPPPALCRTRSHCLGLSFTECHADVNLVLTSLRYRE